MSTTKSVGSTYQIAQIEEVLWVAADKMRNNMDSAEYKHRSDWNYWGNVGWFTIG